MVGLSESDILSTGTQT